MSEEKTEQESMEEKIIEGKREMKNENANQTLNERIKSTPKLFGEDNLKIGYFDWCITGCYYVVYHSALALILKKGYSSKNHDATLCVLIKEYYSTEIDKEDVELINKFYLDYQDLLFYVQSKQKRQDSTYSSNYKFDENEVEDLRIKSIRFVNKVKEILNEN